MIGLSTTRIDITRINSSDDPWDEDYDTGTSIGTNIKASILEQGSIVTIDGEVIVRDITQAIGRVHPSVEINKGDTVYDRTTQKSWIVDEVALNQNPVMKPDKRLALRRTEK